MDYSEGAASSTRDIDKAHVCQATTRRCGDACERTGEKERQTSCEAEMLVKEDVKKNGKAKRTAKPEQPNLRRKLS